MAQITNGFHPHPLPMVYDPPNRITVPLPTTVPAPPPAPGGKYYSVTKAQTIRMMQQQQHVQRNSRRLVAAGGVVEHCNEKPVTMDSRVAWFATNIPRSLERSGGAPGKKANEIVTQVTSFTSKDIFCGALRGWVEPNPTLIADGNERPQNASDSSGENTGSKRTQSRAGSLPPTVLQVIFSYHAPAVLDDTVVFVCRKWYFAVRQSCALQKVRFEFVFRHNYDGRGILYYLASRRRSPPSPGELIANPNAFNAACGLNPLVKVAAIPGIDSLRDRPQSTASSSSRALPPSPRSPRMAKFQPTLQSNYELTNLCSFGPSRFMTANVPYAWAGVDFQDFCVDITAYTFSVNSEINSPFPLSWELQGCAAMTPDEDACSDWKCCTWHVLHKHDLTVAPPMAESPSLTTDRNHQLVPPPCFSATQRTLSFTLEKHLWGPMRRVRIVQTSRNSEWGHSLPISGIELYGKLTRAPKPRV